MTSLPQRLLRFEHELEAAARRDLRNQSRRVAVRAAAASVVAAAVAFGAFGSLPGAGPSRVERAAAALNFEPDRILHFAFVGRQEDNANGVVSWRSEVWQQTSAPFARRSIEVGPEGVRAEMASVGETTQLYDARTNTIYVSSVEPMKTHASSVPPTGKLRVKVLTRDAATGRRSVVTKVLTEREFRRLRAIRPPASRPSIDAPFREQILALLASGSVREDGHVTIAGRDAVRLVSADGRSTYVADAETYAPIEWRTRGEGGGVTLRFGAYEQLPAANSSVFDLAVQYPMAAIDRDPAAYRAAQARLYPNG